jgi:CDP-diacylglycerol--serine O-phosphatidyltransferase
MVMNIKKHIPNAITCGNLLCGCFGIESSFEGHLDLAFYFIIAAAILDFFDGFAARMLKVSSPIGKDLDSLADMVTFGVLPGFIMLQMLLFGSQIPGNSVFPEFFFVAFIIPVFSALRLAKFNNDTRQTDSFIGVPTPANTLLISSIGYILFGNFSYQSGYGSEINLPSINSSWFNMHLLNHPYFLGLVAVLTSFLLVAELPLFALKFKNFGWADNRLRYIFLIIAAVLLILFQVVAVPFIILLYILLSVINNTFYQRKKINP